MSLANRLETYERTREFTPSVKKLSVTLTNKRRRVDTSISFFILGG